LAHPVYSAPCTSKRRLKVISDYLNHVNKYEAGVEMTNIIG